MNNLESLKRFETLPILLHEGVPGHHLKTVYNTEIGRFPAFLQHPLKENYASAPSSTPIYSAHTEGWALYAEQLGLEMGLYSDPFSLIGHFSMSLLRSARLVVDTGIHAFGWSRQKAIDYLISNTALSQDFAEAEVDR